MVRGRGFDSRRLHHLQLVAHLRETTVDDENPPRIMYLQFDPWCEINCTSDYDCLGYSQ